MRRRLSLFRPDLLHELDLLSRPLDLPPSPLVVQHQLLPLLLPLLLLHLKKKLLLLLLLLKKKLGAVHK